MISTLRHLFTPHHTNNHRPRILHPMGMVVMLAIVIGIQSIVSLLELQSPTGIVLGYASNINVQQVLDLTNREREEYGLDPLEMSPKLNQAASAKAADMFKEDYWAHISPDGVPPWTFIKSSGYSYSVAGENLARDFDNTSSMVDAWMSSPTHKANIIHTRYSETGIAVVNGKLDGIKTTLVVQMFGDPIQPVLGNQDTPPAPAPQISEQAEISIDQNQTRDLEFEQGLLGSDTVINPGQAVLSESQTQETVAPQTIISPLDIKKSAALAVVLLIMAVLVIDEIIIRNKKTMRFVGRNLAHLSFLGLSLLLIWNVVQPGLVK